MGKDFDFEDEDDELPRRRSREERPRRRRRPPKSQSIPAVWGIFLAWCGLVGWYWLTTPVNVFQESGHHLLCMVAVGIGFAVAFAFDQANKRE